MQQLLVYWSEMSYLEFYQAPVDDTTLFANLPDLSNFVRGTWPMEDLEASVQAYEGKPGRLHYLCVILTLRSSHGRADR